MNAEEALKICRLAKAASPAQAVDEYTPELWAAVLKPYAFADAYQALIELAGDQEWIHVSHIKRRIKKIRSDRIVGYGVLPTPPHGQTGEEWKRWHLETIKRIADGDEVPRPDALEPSPEHVSRLAELTRGAFQEVPRD